MEHDLALAEVPFLSAEAVADLRLLEIRTLRQLAARMSHESEELRDYLDMDGKSWRRLRVRTAALIRERFPEDALDHILPEVDRRGVAVHRLHDPDRPRYEGDD